MMDRRRALMGAAKAEQIIYKLQAPIFHSRRAVFDTGINLLETDKDWAVFVRLNLLDRESYPVANGVSGTYQSNYNAHVAVLTDVYNNGGFCVSKGLLGGTYATHAASKGKKNDFGQSAYPWTYTGPLKCCVVHNKDNKTFTFYITYGGQSYAKKTQNYTTYPFGSELNLSTFYRGTLNDLVVYAKALNESDCANLLIGG